MRLTLGPSETKKSSIQGGRFYYEKGDYQIRVKIVAGGDAREFDLYPGQGFNNEPGQDRFHALEITNLNDSESQTIDFEVSDREKFDNRATIASTGDTLPVKVVDGSIDLNGLVQIVAAGGVSRDNVVVPVAAGAVVQVLADDINRLKALLYFAGDCYIGKDNAVSAANGFPITGGSDLVDENTAALWVYSAAANSVRVLTDLK